jgi:thiamine-phosphate pyrophosphorylase
LAYLITDPKYYGSEPENFANVLKSVLQRHHVDYACFRDKISSDTDVLAAQFVFTCKLYGIKNIIINSNIEQALLLHADGVHLTSSQYHLIPKAKAAGLQVIVSTHNEEEIIMAEKAGASFITYSPVFETPNKGNPKGLEDLKDKVAKIRTKIIALGGIVTAEHINNIEKTGAHAFASIRYFIENNQGM